MSILCLMGPTASGKTELAVALAQIFPLEIISVDSAMVYKGLNIGTAKPDARILKIAPHRLIDIRDPSDPYSVAEFWNDALSAIEAILSQQKIPFLVGGTMMYFRLLQNGLAQMPSADAALRAHLIAMGEDKGWDFLHARLQEIDPEAALRIHPHDKQRIQRALEVYTLTGKNLSWHIKNSKGISYPMINLILAPSNRIYLHACIKQRFLRMLENGFMEEVERLYKRKDLHLALPSIRSVGYRQAWEYLQGNLRYEEMKNKALAATRQLAKRQYTWLRSIRGATWFQSEDKNLHSAVISFLRKNLSLS